MITAVNNKSIKDSRELAQTISMMAPGTSVKLTLLHKGETKTMEITLGKMPGEHTAKAETKSATSENGVPNLGLTLAPATEVAGAGGKGVAVVAVDPDGPAADHGLKKDLEYLYYEFYVSKFHFDWPTHAAFINYDAAFERLEILAAVFTAKNRMMRSAVARLIAINSALVRTKSLPATSFPERHER